MRTGLFHATITWRSWSSSMTGAWSARRSPASPRGIPTSSRRKRPCSTGTTRGRRWPRRERGRSSSCPIGSTRKAEKRPPRGISHDGRHMPAGALLSDFSGFGRSCLLKGSHRPEEVAHARRGPRAPGSPDSCLRPAQGHHRDGRRGRNVQDPPRRFGGGGTRPDPQEPRVFTVFAPRDEAFAKIPRPTWMP